MSTPLAGFPNRVPPPGYLDALAERRWEACDCDVARFIAECEATHRSWVPPLRFAVIRDRVRRRVKARRADREEDHRLFLEGYYDEEPPEGYHEVA